MTAAPATHAPTITVSHDAEPTDAFVRVLARMCLERARREIEAETQEQLPDDNQEEDAA